MFQYLALGLASLISYTSAHAQTVELMTFAGAPAVDNGGRVTGFEESAIAAMLGYDWLGNIRELENVIERGVIMARYGEPLRQHNLFSGGEVLGPPVWRPGKGASLPADAATESAAELVDAGLDLATVEQQMIARALAKASGNKTRAAKMLGITRSQLLYRLSANRSQGEPAPR